MDSVSAPGEAYDSRKSPGRVKPGRLILISVSIERQRVTWPSKEDIDTLILQILPRRVEWCRRQVMKRILELPKHCKRDVGKSLNCQNLFLALQDRLRPFIELLKHVLSLENWLRQSIELPKPILALQNLLWQIIELPKPVLALQTDFGNSLNCQNVFWHHKTKFGNSINCQSLFWHYKSNFGKSLNCQNLFWHDKTECGNELNCQNLFLALQTWVLQINELLNLMWLLNYYSTVKGIALRVSRAVTRLTVYRPHRV